MLGDKEFKLLLEGKPLKRRKLMRENIDGDSESCIVYHEAEGEISEYEVNASLHDCPRKWVEMMTQNGSFDIPLEVYTITQNDRYGVGQLDDPNERGRYPETIFWTRKDDASAYKEAYAEASTI